MAKFEKSKKDDDKKAGKESGKKDKMADMRQKKGMKGKGKC